MSHVPFYYQIAETFYWFHQNPELSFEEYETTRRIREFLEYHKVHILDLDLKTGLVAEIQGADSGPVIALRCDIDALPVQEETGLPYASAIAGKMHACGHDFHTAVMLYVAKVLQEQREHLQGRVKILFQPAEESSVGALEVIKTGVLDDVDGIYGLHTDITLPVGTVGIVSGSITAAVDRFTVKLTGKGTHAAHPQDGIDPVLTASQIVTLAQSIVSRNIDPFSQGLLSVTRITAGNTWNVIPQTAELEGTVRTMGRHNRRLIEERFRTLVQHVALSQGAAAEIHWLAGPPATNNAISLEQVAATIAKEQGLKVQTPLPSLGGEDFAFYQEKIPGFFIRIGTGESCPNHHPKFRVDTNALEPAVNYFAALAQRTLSAIKSGEWIPAKEENSHD